MNGAETAHHYQHTLWHLQVERRLGLATSFSRGAAVSRGEFYQEIVSRVFRR